MRILIVEDDFTSRKLLGALLAPFGECDIAVDGVEAVEAVRMAIDEERPYQLICLDIMMPKLDGHGALEKIRALEKSNGLTGNEGTRIIMTTALNDSQNILQAFRSQCEGYLVKPIDKAKLLGLLREIGLIEETAP
jgi:two-component system chemotaxis response regulator CheY